MCGIAGLLHPDAERCSHTVGSMLARIRHRGPDDDGLWTGNGCALGHARLAIIDLSPRGHQPLANEDGSIWVVLNGEIYNYRELRDLLSARGHRFRGESDTEVLPHLYEDYGLDFVTHLRGMFAIALWDMRERRLVLARDRAGKKPLFYAPISDGFAFASEMKALFAVPGIDLSVRAQGIHDYLGFGTVPGPDTVYTSIRRVRPAHVLTIDSAGMPAERPYWSLAFHPKIRISRDDAIGVIEERLRDAVRLRLRSDVPVGSFLSGGIDSGLVVALAAQESSARLRTYSVGFDDSAFDERDLARQVAERFDTQHTEFLVSAPQVKEIPAIVGHYDEPYSDPSVLPSFAVARRAAADIKVVLNGDGADEVFAGYRHVIAARLLARFDGLAPGSVRSAVAALVRAMPTADRGRSRYQFLHRTLRAFAGETNARFQILTGDRMNEAEKSMLYGHRRGANDGLLPSLRLIDDTAMSDEPLGPVDRMLEVDFHLLLGGDHLVKMDMASMAFALEARSPFLDQEVIEFTARLPEHFKLDGKTTKPLLRSLADRLLPPDVARAPKRGFEIPLQRWMQQDLNGLLRETVLDPRSYAMTHFDPDATRELIGGAGSDAKRWAGIVWTMLCLEFWWENYMNNVLPAAAEARRSAGPVKIAV